MTMMNLHILTRAHGEYDAYEREIVGVTVDKSVSHAFLEIGKFDGYYVHEVEIVTLNVLDGKLREQINDWLDPKKNPMCECGHRLLHHRRKNNSGTCKYNHSYPTDLHPKGHRCKGFTLAAEQPLPISEVK